MTQRQFIALGTASQVPTRARNHNGYLLRWDGIGLLFDPGEGTQRQLIHAGVSVNRIHHVLVTHFHGDHCLGLPGIVQRLSLDNVPHDVHVHYPASGQVYYERLRHASIFYDQASTVPKPIEEAGVIYRGDGFRIETQALSHTVPCWGFRLVEDDGIRFDPVRLNEAGVTGPLVGKLKTTGEVQVDGRTVRLEDVSTPRPGQVVAFVMDTCMCDGAVALAQDADLLVCESTYLESEATEARERGHMTAAEAARLAQKAGVRRLVLTHFSQRYPDVSAFVDEARPIHEDVVAVDDGDVVDVPHRDGTRRA